MTFSCGRSRPRTPVLRRDADNGARFRTAFTRICQFWAHAAMDDRPWGGPSQPASPTFSPTVGAPTRSPDN